MEREYPPMLSEDKNILVFFEQQRENGLATQKAGRPIFNNVLMLRISSPGDKSSAEYEVDVEYPESFPHPIHGALKKNRDIYQRYGKFIERHKETREAGGVLDGTPLEQWPGITFRQAALLKSLGIQTVESLAEAHDNALHAIGMGARELRQKAKDYLLTAADTAAALEAQRQKREIEARFTALEDNFKALAEALQELPAEAQNQVKASLAKRNQKKAAA